MVLSYEGMGDLKRAVEVLGVVIERDGENARYRNKMESLKAEIKLLKGGN